MAGAPFESDDEGSDGRLVRDEGSTVPTLGKHVTRIGRIVSIAIFVCAVGGAVASVVHHHQQKVKTERIVDFAASEGDNCWSACKGKQGACAWCGSGGSGACCRKNWGGSPKECGNGALGCPTKHCCVVDKTTRLQQQVDALRDQVDMLEQQQINALRDQVDMLEYKVDKKCPPEPDTDRIRAGIMGFRMWLKALYLDNWYDATFIKGNPGTTVWTLSIYKTKQEGENSAARVRADVSCFDVKFPKEDGYKMVTNWGGNEPWDVTLKKGDILVWLCDKTTDSQVQKVKYMGFNPAGYNGRTAARLEIVPIGDATLFNGGMAGAPWPKGSSPLCLAPIKDGLFRWRYKWRQA